MLCSCNLQILFLVEDGESVIHDSADGADGDALDASGEEKGGEYGIME